MSSATVAKHYARLISLWPKDLLRPNHLFTKTIEARAARFAPLSASKDASSTPVTSSQPKTPESGISSTSSSSTLSPARELHNINALYTLLDNRYAKQFPISQDVLKPKSNPEYYDRLMREIEAAPNKSWLQAKIDEWKMKIRFK